MALQINKIPMQTITLPADSNGAKEVIGETIDIECSVANHDRATALITIEGVNFRPQDLAVALTKMMHFIDRVSD